MDQSGTLPGQQDRLTTWIGIVMSVAFVVLFIATVMVPRTPIDERDFLHAVHYSMGFTVLVLVVWRYFHARRVAAVVPPAGMPASAFGFSRTILGALLATFAVTAVIGFAYAWSNGHHVSIYGLPLPQIVPESYPIRTTMGYFHSALGFYYIAVIGLWLIVGVYHHARYGCGLLRLMPGPRI